MTVDVTQRAVPMLSYEDVGGTAAWLARAFGFRERGERFTDDDGRVTHAELELDGALVMLGWPGPAYRAPKRHAETCEVERAVAQTPFVADGVLVYVDDLDRHLEGARGAGATILREIEDGPFGRLYVAEDVEGHRWMFMQPA
jgi:PhnB protein